MIITFNELAERELNDATTYYELERARLGVAFLAEIERCTAAILEHPFAAPEILPPVRRRLCGRFPYAILYATTEREIRVLAVMNLRRRPNYWVGRS